MAEFLRPYVYLLAAFGLVLLNAFFVAAEFAIVKIRGSRIETMVQEGKLGSRAAQHATQHLNAYLSACQLGITLASLGLGWIGEPAFAELIRPLLATVGIWSETAVHSIAISGAFAIIMILHLVLGELVPKQLAIQRTEGMVLGLALPLRLSYWLFYPAIWLLNHASNGLLRLVGIEPATAESLAHSEEELRIILSESAEAGTVSGVKRRILENVFTYTHRTAQEIMIPRNEIAHVSLARSWPENLEVIRSGQHTRYPLCTLSLDHVVGMIHIKDLYNAVSALTETEQLLKLKREILFFPESASLEELQRQFQQKRVHMAIVVDEYGGTAGLVTLEDVIEELVGEIQDEFDREESKIQKTPEGHVLDGLLLIEEVNEHLGLGLEETEARTIGGLLTAELKRIARVGDRVTLNGRELRVVEMKGRRVAKVLVAPGRSQPAAEDPTEARTGS